MKFWFLSEVVGIEHRYVPLLLHEPDDDPPDTVQVEQPLIVIGERQHKEAFHRHVLQDEDPLLKLVLAHG